MLNRLIGGRPQRTLEGRWPLLAPLAALLILASPSSVSAGNTDGVLLGDDASLMGGAVTAVVNDGSALWYNPAGLMAVNRNSVDFSLTAYSLRLYRIPEAVIGGGESANADANEVTVIPSAISYVRTTKSGLRLAFGVFTTAQEDYSQRSDLSFAEGTTGEESDWLITLANRLTLYHGVVGIGWSANPRLHFGVTADLSYVSFIQSGQIGGGLSAGGLVGQALFAATESNRTSISGLGVRLGAGLLWKPTDELSIGAAFQTASYVVFSTVSQQSVASFAVAPPDTPGTILFEVSDANASGAGFDQFEPYRWRLGIAYQFSRVLLSVDADVQLDQRVENDGWNASYNGRVGLLISISDAVALGLGGFTDRSTLGEAPTEFGESVLDFYGFTAGVKLSKTRLFAETEDADSITFETTIAFRAAFGSGEFSGFEVLDDLADDEILTPILTNTRITELSIYLGAGIRF
ncbi:MAG: hypothetical protein AAGF92_01800 [Myxococcota bacterium]